MRRFFFFLSWLISTTLSAQHIDSVLSENHAIYFEVHGQGEPVYLLAGGPAVDPAYVRDVVQSLADSNLVVLVHQRGTGMSKGPFDEASINIDQYCRDIHAVKEKLKHPQFILLGHSWGGMLAMHYTTLFTQDVKKLLLVNSGGCNLHFFNYFGDNIDSRLSHELQDSVRLFNQTLEKNRSISGDSAMQESLTALFALLRVRSAGYYQSKALASKKYLTPETYNIPISQFMMSKLFRTGWDLRDELQQVHIPTLIIIGRQDPIDLETAYLIRDAIPGSKLAIIERCGHFPWVEQPAKFYQLVADFIREE